MNNFKYLKQCRSIKCQYYHRNTNFYFAVCENRGTSHHIQWFQTNRVIIKIFCFAFWKTPRPQAFFGGMVAPFLPTKNREPPFKCLKTYWLIKASHHLCHVFWQYYWVKIFTCILMISLWKFFKIVNLTLYKNFGDWDCSMFAYLLLFIS